MTKDWIAIEETTGIFDGFYTYKDDAIDSAQYLTERFVGSNWNVAHKDWLRHGEFLFWRTEGMETLTELFVDTD